MKKPGILILLLTGLACQGQPGSTTPEPAASPPRPASAVEAMLRDDDRPREKLDRKQLQGAW